MAGAFIPVSAEDGGAFDALLVPALREPAPGLVLLTEIFGINGVMRDAAAHLAAAGYTVLAPDLFWRQQRRVELDYEGEDRARAFALYRAYDHELGARDVATCVAWLRARPQCSGKIGIVGYCFGGTLAWLGAARGTPNAAVSFYGTQIHRYLDEASAIRCPTALHLGDADAHVPADAVSATKAACAKHARIDLHIYPGVGHAFMNPKRPTYDPAAASLAFGRALALLQSM